MTTAVTTNKKNAAKKTASKSKTPKKKSPRTKKPPAKSSSTGSCKSDATAVQASFFPTPPARAVIDLPLLVVDNGGWTVKHGRTDPPPPGAAAGLGARLTDGLPSSASIAPPPRRPPRCSSMQNATARPPHQIAILAGDEIAANMKNLGQLSWTHPLERGMICDTAAQLRVWARVLENECVVPAPNRSDGGGTFLSSVAGGGGGLGASLGGMGGRRVKKAHAAAGAAASAVAAGAASSTTGESVRAKVSASNCAFVLLEPPFVPSAISERVDHVLFRELGMSRVARRLGACMAAVRYLSHGRDTVSGRSSSGTNPSELGNADDGNGTKNSELGASSSAEWINDGTECCCVVDSGHSFTHVVPTHGCVAVEDAIRRINIGGKVLTNLLKEAVTYRQWNMMDEYHIVNDAKEQLCFVSNDFTREMKNARLVRRGLRWFDREFLLPDFVNTFKGTVRLPAPLQWQMDLQEKKKKEQERLKLAVEKKEQNASRARASDRKKIGEETIDGKAKVKINDDEDGGNDDDDKQSKYENDDDEGDDSDEETDEQRLKNLKRMREEERRRREMEEIERQAIAMSVERFAVPEVLFRPSDIGLDHGGVAESIAESIEACDPILRAAMYRNLLLVGGNARIPHFKERLEVELRKLAPVNYEVRVHLPDDPVSYAWEGAKEFTSRPDFQRRFCVDRLDWEAHKKAGKNQLEIWGGKVTSV